MSTTINSTICEAAAAASDAGIAVIPINHNTKKPLFAWKDFISRRPTEDELDLWFVDPINPPKALAVVAGAVSGGLTIMDFDVPGFYEAWRNAVGELADGLPVQRTGSTEDHYQVFARSTNVAGNEKLAWVPDEKEVTGRIIAIETRGEGGYACIPPSLHPEGGTYRWLSGNLSSIPIISTARLGALHAAARKLCEAPHTRQQLEAVEKNAKESTSHRQSSNGHGGVIDEFNKRLDIEQSLQNYGYTKGSTGQYARPGRAAHIGSVSVKDGRSYHHSTNDVMNDGYWHRPFDLFCQYEHGGDCKAAVKAAADVLGINHARTNTAASPEAPEPRTTEETWSDPIPLEPEPPPELPDGVLTGWGGAMVYAVAEAMEVPLELPLAFHLAGLGTACQGRFCVRPEPGYFEQLAFWAATAMVPGSRKTPAMLAVFRWGYEWQRKKRVEFEPIIEKAKADEAVLAGRIKATQQKAMHATDPTERAVLLQEIEKLRAESQPIPVAPRLLAEDCTSEHLATLLTAQKERLGIVSDEGGALDTWGGRYSNGVANIDLILKAHSGSPVIQDRGSRAAAHLNQPLLSIGLAPQPTVIAALVNNQTFRRRGLPARFFFFLPPSRLGHRTLEGVPIPDQVADEYARRMVELAEMDGQPDGEGGFRARVLGLSGQAWRVWKDFAHEVEPMMGAGGELEAMTDWGGKLPGAVARIAGLFHLAQHGPEAIRVDEIDHDTMSRAVALGRFSISHAKAVFEGMDGSGDLEIARRMWREASSDRRVDERQHQYGDPALITARDLWVPVRGTYKTVKEVDPAFRLLIDHNFLRELPNAELGRAGRPSRRFQINPALMERRS